LQRREVSVSKQVRERDND